MQDAEELQPIQPLSLVGNLGLKREIKKNAKEGPDKCWLVWTFIEFKYEHYQRFDGDG